MEWRTRGWWILAGAAAVAGYAVDLLSLDGFTFGWVASRSLSCPGEEINVLLSRPPWVGVWSVPLACAGLPAITVAFLASWFAGRRGRPRAGRMIARLMAGLLLVAAGLQPLLLALDAVVDRACVERWGGPDGVLFFVVPAIGPLLSAVFVLVAVGADRPGRAGGRTAVGRIALSLVPLALLALLPAADLAKDPLTPVAGCPEWGEWQTPQNATEAVCDLRRRLRWSRTSGDTEVLAQGRYLCGVSMRADQKEIAEVRARYGVEVQDSMMTELLALICPEVKAAQYAREAEVRTWYTGWKADNERRCARRPRHRPLVRPLAVRRKMVWPEYGILEAYEADGPQGGHEWGDLVEVGPGTLRVLVDADPVTCATVEVYRRRPPVEVRGWDGVVEVGYRSVEGHVVLGDMEGGDELPDLAFRGKGDYRVRVHLRAADSRRDPDAPQDLLIIVYPGRGGRAVVYR